VEEVMRGLDDIVRQGKVLYIGVSNAPAWWIAQVRRQEPRGRRLAGAIRNQTVADKLSALQNCFYSN